MTTPISQKTLSYAYTLYGLHIHSEEPLPLLPAERKEPPALTIAFLPASARPTINDAHLLYSHPARNAYGDSPMEIFQITQPTGNICYWLHTRFKSGWTDFLLREDGREVQIIERENFPHQEFLPMLLGNALTLVLRLQGYTALHASAVLIEGEVAAFIGPSETGKSTTLAALLQQGAAFFSDDLVPLVNDGGRPSSYSGHLRLGLWPDSVATIFGPTADLPLLEFSTKRVYTPSILDDPTRPKPIRAVYLLAPRGTDPSLSHTKIVQLSQGESVTALMPHTTARMLRTPFGHTNDLAHIAALVRTIPVRRIERPNDLRQIDAIAQTILQDINALPKIQK